MSISIKRLSPIHCHQAAQGTERTTGQVEAGDRWPAVGQLCKMDLVLLMVIESEGEFALKGQVIF